MSVRYLRQHKYTGSRTNVRSSLTQLPGVPMVLAVMRRPLLAICAAALLVPVAAEQAGAHSSGRGIPCASAHPEPLLADSQADVYLASRGGTPFSAFGCVYGHRRAVLLGLDVEGCLGSAEFNCEGVAQITLRGTTVAYEESKTSGDFVIARDLRSGRVLRRVLAGAQPGIGPTTAIVTKSNGALAWIVEAKEENETTKAPAQYEVRAADKSGVRVLASGSGIAPNSLALAGNTVYWTQGGKPASTSLH